MRIIIILPKNLSSCLPLLDKIGLLNKHYGRFYIKTTKVLISLMKMKAKIHTSNFECLLTREVALCVCELSLKLENAELLLL